MRRLFLSLILSLAVFVASAAGISTYKELAAFAKAVNKGADISMWQNEKGAVCLTADIDMKKGKKFPTIKLFDGTFDGCGHKLYNWSAKSPIFAELGTKAIVRNIVIDASCKMVVEISYNDENENIGFIAGVNRGMIINCINHGAVEFVGEEANRQMMIGGIVGTNLNVVHKCKNTGDISARTSLSNTDGGKAIRIGGIIGTCYGKDVVAGTTISYCENSGNISYMGDFPNNNAGGVVGESSRSTVKSCVNRGNVAIIAMPFPGKNKPISRAGGITAWANNDIVSCDNFGVVTVSGTHESVVAGICARANIVLTMVDCVNYGKISANTSAAAMVGGLIAQTIRPNHIAQCFNYGDVTSEGAQSPAWCAGICAQMSMAKGPKTGAYIRDCANYGNITNKSTAAKSSTGGIVASGSGYLRDKVAVNSIVRDCGNHGKISDAARMNFGPIVGWKKYLNVHGTQYDDMAKLVKPWSNGTNIFGRVVDEKGMPIEGVVVSDGEQSIKTDVNGEYAMKSNLSEVRFVMISVPSDYEIPVRANRPQFFRRVPRYAEAVRADFVLTERAKKSDEFVLAMVGDPQTRGLQSDNAVERFRDVIVSDIKAYTEKSDKEVYTICLGDLVYNYMTSYDDYMDVLAKSTTPMFSVIGNHDFDQRTLFDSKLGTPYFEAYLAPQNYSFNIGKMHFVVVNNIVYDRPTNKHRYKTGLSAATLKWLENDLKHISKETTVVICSHAPLFKWRDNFYEKSVNYKKYCEILSKYDNLYSWAGHWHQNYEYNFATAPEKYASLKGVKAITVGRCIGMIRLNRELNTCGSPNGYMVAEVKGDKMEWYYKTAGHDRNYQMRVYTPTDTESEYVRANIWSYSPDTWSAIEWWENGQKVAEMVPAKGEFDPDYLKIYEEHKQQKLGKTEQRYSKPVKSPYLFRVKPSEGVRSGEIRVTDHFGVTYTQAVAW